MREEKETTEGIRRAIELMQERMEKREKQPNE
jgi:hypothetical protein